MSENNSSHRSLFPGQSAIVLGGTGAVGQVICRKLAESGLDVRFSYGSRLSKAEALAEEIRALGRNAEFSQVSLSDSESIRAFVAPGQNLVDTAGVAVYTAGPKIGQPFVGAVTDEEWTSAVHPDIDGHFVFAKSLIPLFRSRGEGSLVSVTTTATARYSPRDILSAAPKAAVELTVKAIAKEEGRFGIRANCVAPGLLTVGMGQHFLESEYSEAAADTMRRNLPLGKFGEAEDIAEAVVFLASRRANYITGQTLAVDGGWQI